MAKEPEGVVYSTKNPSPKASPKSFVWPDRAVATDDIRQRLAASLQELLPKRNWTHIDLTRALFGENEKGALRRVAIPRAWLRAAGPFMTEEEAAWTAELLGVSMARLLEPQTPYNPNSDMIRKKAPYQRKDKKHTDPEIDDGRWALPEGVKAPVFKQATLEDRPGWASVEIKATVPDDVSQAIFSMLKCKAAPKLG